MRELAPNFFLLPLTPRHGVNAYYADSLPRTRSGGVLFDAGIPSSAKRILKALDDRPLEAHALTHGHYDHAGASAEVCAARDVPLWCGAGDADAVESGDLRPLVPADRLLHRLVPPRVPPAPVARRLQAGDEVAGFTAIATPGHSPGHLVYWREADGILILGDVLNNMHLVTTRPGLREPPRVFTPDPVQNRASARTLLGLRPSLVVFGHGPPLRDPDRFEAFLRALPA